MVLYRLDFHLNHRFCAAGLPFVVERTAAAARSGWLSMRFSEGLPNLNGSSDGPGVRQLSGDNAWGGLG